MTQRIQVNLSDEMITKVDNYAAMLGMSRSGLCAYFIGQGTLAFETSLSACDEIAKKMLEKSTN